MSRPALLLVTALTATVALTSATSCLQSGVARLPARTDVLITTGDVEWNYEALAFIEIVQVRCAPCGNLETAYEHLSESIKDEFSRHAKDLGATAVINVHYGAVSLGLTDQVRVIGTAIKPTGVAENIIPTELRTVSVEAPRG